MKRVLLLTTCLFIVGCSNESKGAENDVVSPKIETESVVKDFSESNKILSDALSERSDYVGVYIDSITFKNDDLLKVSVNGSFIELSEGDKNEIATIVRNLPSGYSIYDLGKKPNAEFFLNETFVGTNKALSESYNDSTEYDWVK